MEETVDREKRLFTERFNSRLEYWMKANHKTQDDFRNEAEIGSKNTVTSWKQGKSFPRDSQMDAICRILGCEADVFKPFFPAEKERFRNAETIARAAELDRYAREKGLKEATFQHIIHLPDFISTVYVGNMVCGTTGDPGNGVSLLSRLLSSSLRTTTGIGL